jgi:putative methanogenesis marker protein 8
MIREQVVREIKEFGIYKRGDSEIRFNPKTGKARLTLDIKNDYGPVKELFPKFNKDNLKQLAEDPARRDGRISQENTADNVEDAVRPLVNLANAIRAEYPDVHISRRAAAHVLIHDNKAVEATPTVVKWCPLSSWLFERDFKENLLAETNDVVIGKNHSFDNKRTLETEQDPVPFGASESMSDAMRAKKIDCMVSACEGIGTIITDRPETTLGVGAVMTGLVHTAPNPTLIERSTKLGNIIVHPETARIDQVAGVKMALDRGYRKIAVTVAGTKAEDIKKIIALKRKHPGAEINVITVCTTNVTKEQTDLIKKHSAIVYSCASKNIREAFGRKCSQLGTKIPVYLSKEGVKLVAPRLAKMDPTAKKPMEELIESGSQFFAYRGNKSGNPVIRIKAIDKLAERPRGQPRPLTKR